MNEDYHEAAQRMFHDGDHLLNSDRYGTACHLFGLAAECAVKSRLKVVAQASGNAGSQMADTVPRKHLPDLVSDAYKMLSGRRVSGRGGLLQVLSMPKYMEGWRIENRYWQDASFDEPTCAMYRLHARRTLSSVGIQ